MKNTQEPEIIKIQKDGDKEEDVKDMEVKLMILANGQSGKDVRDCGREKKENKRIYWIRQRLEK